MKTLKKAISTVTALTTIVWLSGVSMFAVSVNVASAAIVDGSLISSNATNPDGTPTLASLDVYIVKLVGTKKFKRLILNPQVFNSYQHFNWNSVQEVNPSVLDEYTTSGLVRVDADPAEKVYGLAPSGDTGMKGWINLTSTQFVDEGHADADSIYTINSTDAGNYTAVGDVTTVAQLTTFLTAGTLPDTTPVPVTGGLTVSLSANTQASKSYPQNAQAVPFTTINLTAGEADVTVTGITVKRTGLGSYADVDTIYAFADGVIKGSLKSLPSSDEVLLVLSGANSIVVSKGTSKSVTIYANMNAGTAGDVNALKVTGIDSNASSTTGLPVSGNEMSIGSTSAPTATFADASISTSRNVGDVGIDATKVKITNTNSNEDISVNSIVFKSVVPTSGTKIDNSDIGNFELFEGSTKLAGPAELDSNGYVTLTLATPSVILKGGSKYKTYTLKADITGGPDRKITMDIYRAVDLNITGNTNGFRTKNTDSYTATNQTITVANSDLSVSLDTTNTPKTQTVLNDQTITLLKGKLSAGKGAVTVTGMTVTLNGNDMDFGTTDEYENLKVYINDVLMSSATGSTLGTADNQTTKAVAFTDEFGVSGTATVEVTIDVKTVTDADWIQAVIAGASMTATRDSDGTSITPTGTATGNKQTIGAASLTATLAAVPVSATKVKGSSDVEFFGFNLATSSNDSVKVTDISLLLEGTGGTAAQADVSNVRIYSGSTLIAGPKNLDSAKKAIFSGLDINLGKSANVKYTVKADINSTINDANVTGLNLEISDMTAQDSQGDDITTITGGNSGTLVNSAATTLITVVDRGTLNVELLNATPKTHQVLANSTGDVDSKFKFSANYEDVIIKKIILTTASGSYNDDEIAKVAIKVGGTTVASTESVVSGVATINIPEANWITIPATGNKVVEVVTDYNSTNNSVADSGAVVRWTINSFATDIEADGAVKDIYGAVTSSTGTGVTKTASTVTAAIDDATGITASDTTITYDTAVGSFTAGNIITIDTEDILITEVTSSTVLTVRRAVGGTTAATHADNAVITEYTQKLAGESAIVYSNFPSIAAPTTEPSGSLVVGEYDVFKFVVTDKTLGEESINLEEVVLRFDMNGAGACAGDFCVSDVKLYNGSNQVGSTYTTDVTASGDVTFAGLDSDTDAIINGATTFTVKATIASGAAFTAGDSLKVSINNFGSADAAGTITAGDVDWEDGEAPTSQIEWIDTSLTSIDGNTFSFSS